LNRTILDGLDFKNSFFCSADFSCRHKPFSSAIGSLFRNVVPAMSVGRALSALRNRRRKAKDKSREEKPGTAGTPFDPKALAFAICILARMLQMHFIDAYGILPRHWAPCLAASPLTTTISSVSSCQQL
jgi:hypothetical protein